MDSAFRARTPVPGASLPFRQTLSLPSAAASTAALLRPPAVAARRLECR
ncbi:hypothetical protein SAMN05444320_103521 [Streptoalloteichus hindustanus]|uniref:Uncharacterized protein n=1 Tax=Streptoalloteichus hindustanus TaxID=2017 RepID=A0A1M5BEJ7_STRHI|nr:hypothetical protein SAMN05444320_103521 [Streptoalloteichus hindustanus]